MLIFKVPLTALAVFCAFAHAQSAPAPDGTAVPDKSAALERIQEAATQLGQRRAGVERCCHGSLPDCTPAASAGARASLQAANSKIESGAAGLDAQKAAVTMGDFGDDLKNANSGIHRACADARTRCAEATNTSESSLRAQFPETEDTDYAGLRAIGSECMKIGPIMTEQQLQPSENRRSGAGAPPGAEPALPPGTGVPQVVVEHDNSEWRQGLKTESAPTKTASMPDVPKDDKTQADPAPAKNHRGEKLAAVLSEFSKMEAQSMATTHSNFQAAAVENQQAAPPVTSTGSSGTRVGAAPSPQAMALGRGTVGLREGFSNPQGARSPLPQSSLAGAAPTGVRLNSAGGVRNSSASRQPLPVNRGGGSGLESLSAEQPYTSPYKKLNTGVDGGSGGSQPNRAGRSRPGLEEYLPNARLGPSSRSVAGEADTKNPEILSQGKDVWQNMSMRLQYICKIGRLYDCK